VEAEIILPWQLARQWHENNVAGETFEEVLGWHMSHGLVFCTTDMFLLARETHWDGETCDDDKPSNAWFVELAAAVGSANPVREFMRVAPRPHQFALWCRHNSFEVKAHEWAKLAKKVRL
jgi:hypothetical protein